MHQLAEAQTAINTANESGQAAAQATEAFKSQCDTAVAAIITALNNVCDSAVTTHQTLEAHQTSITAALGAAEEAYQQAVALGDAEAIAALQIVREHLEQAITFATGATESCTNVMAPLNEAKEGSGFAVIAATANTIETETHEGLNTAAAAIGEASKTVQSRMQ